MTSGSTPAAERAKRAPPAVRETNDLGIESSDPIDQRINLLKKRADIFIERMGVSHEKLAALREKIEAAQTEAEKQKLAEEMEQLMGDQTFEKQVELIEEDPLLIEKADAAFDLIKEMQAHPELDLNKIKAENAAPFITDPELQAAIDANPLVWAEVKSIAQDGLDVAEVVTSPEFKLDDKDSWAAAAEATGRDINKTMLDEVGEFIMKNKVLTGIALIGGLWAIKEIFFRDSSNEKNVNSGTSWWKWGLGGIIAMIGLSKLNDAMDGAVTNTGKAVLDTTLDTLGVSPETRKQAEDTIDGLKNNVQETANDIAPNTLASIESLQQNLGSMNASGAEIAIQKLMNQAEREGVPIVVETAGSTFWLYVDTGIDVVALPISVGQDAISGITKGLKGLGVSEGTADVLGTSMGVAATAGAAGLAAKVTGIRAAIRTAHHAKEASDGIRFVWKHGKWIAKPFTWTAGLALKGAGKVIEKTGAPALANKARAAISREFAKRAVGEGAKKFFEEATRRVSATAVGKFAAKRIAAAGASNVVPIAGQVAAIGLTVWTVAEVGFMAYDAYDAYDTHKEIKEREKLPEKSIQFDPETEKMLAGANEADRIKILSKLPKATLTIEREGMPGVETYFFESGQVVDIEVDD